MKYFVALYVTSYRRKAGGEAWEVEIDETTYARALGSFAYLEIDGRLSLEGALAEARRWASNHKEAKDIILRKAESFRSFLDSLPETIPSGKCVTICA